MSLSGNGQRCPLVLSVTTRGIGINLCEFYHQVAAVTRRVDRVPTIYQSYRAILALVENRLANIENLASARSSHDIYEYSLRLQINNRLLAFSKIPIFVKKILEAINTVHHNGVFYVPAMSKDIEIEGKYMPRPENIILSNLRKTVMALAESTEDQQMILYKKQFHDHNSIPAAKWDDNFNLLNADDIIPADYMDNMDRYLDDDLFALSSLSNILYKYSNVFGEVINHSLQQKSIFLCNEMDKLRVPDLKHEESLNYYYRRAMPLMNIDSFYSRVNLNRDQLLVGACNLLGEYPYYEGCYLNPIYALRAEHVNPYYYSGMTYTIGQRASLNYPLINDYSSSSS